MQTCTRCKVKKPANTEFFPPHKYKNNGLDSWCRSCRNEYRRKYQLPRGVTDIKKVLEVRELKQCLICGLEKPLLVDHDHITGEVRGGLCMNCNFGLGHFKDSPELLRLAALYLEGKCACGKCDVYWGGKSVNK